jgi:hypothetical protein
MRCISIDNYLPSWIITVLEDARSRIPEGSRISKYRVPVVEYNLAVSKVINLVRGEFHPTLLGLAVEDTTKSVPSAVVVQDV